jgi:Tol biopolymer transport system component
MRDPTISDDGRYVAFASNAASLVEGDTNDAWDVFVHDCLTGRTSRVSVASDGSQAEGDSLSPAISGDGNSVVFASSAANLLEPGAAKGEHVYIHDRGTHRTTRVSTIYDGAEGNASYSAPAVSADGAQVAYVAVLQDAVPRDDRAYRQVYLHDRLTGTDQCVSVGVAGELGRFDSRCPKLSADGTRVAFVSFAPNLVVGESESASWDCYVRDLPSGQTTRVNVADDGREARVGALVGRSMDNGMTVAISPDGGFVAFTSVGYNLVSGDANRHIDAFVHDMAAGTTRLASVTEDRVQACRDCGTPVESDESIAISRGGRFVVFATQAWNLFPDQREPPPGETPDLRGGVAVKDMDTGRLERLHSADPGQAAPLAGSDPAVSADGRYVVCLGSAADPRSDGADRIPAGVVVTDRGPEAIAPVARAPLPEGPVLAQGWVAYRGSTLAYVVAYPGNWETSEMLQGVHSPQALEAQFLSGVTFAWVGGRDALAEMVSAYSLDQEITAEGLLAVLRDDARDTYGPGAVGDVQLQRIGDREWVFQVVPLEGDVQWRAHLAVGKALYVVVLSGAQIAVTRCADDFRYVLETFQPAPPDAP